MAYRERQWLSADEYQAICMARQYYINPSEARKIIEEAHSTRIMDTVRRYRATLEAMGRARDEKHL